MGLKILLRVDKSLLVLGSSYSTSVNPDSIRQTKSFELGEDPNNPKFLLRITVYKIICSFIRVKQNSALTEFRLTEVSCTLQSSKHRRKTKRKKWAVRL